MDSGEFQIDYQNEEKPAEMGEGGGNYVYRKIKNNRAEKET